MRCAAFLGAAVLASSLACAQLPADSAASAASPPQLIVSYIDSSGKDAAALDHQLQQYARQLNASPSRPTVEVLQQMDRPGHMLVLERWPAGAAAAADHGGESLQAQTRQLLAAPIDRRVNAAMAPLLTSGGPDKALNVVLHVDVLPTAIEQGKQSMLALRQAVLAAPGALGFEVAVQANKPNHFAVHEVWTNRAAYEAFVASAPSRDFRERLAPLSGSPFDDQLYSVVSR